MTQFSSRINKDTLTQGLLILAQVACFAFICSVPIYWMDDEMLHTGFFWSMSGGAGVPLHTGFSTVDLSKPFATFYIDGAFRSRQFSYLLEMVSFKFWQLFGMVFDWNFTLLGLHILNALLLGLLLAGLTGRKACGWFGALIFLNCGIALGTILFPFRNAKMLVVTLFLLAWNILLRSRPQFTQAPRRFFVGFFGVMLLAFFTDEIAFYIFPLCFIFIVLRDGWRGLLNRRMALGSLVSAAVFLTLLCLFYKISMWVSQPTQFEGSPAPLFFNDLIRYVSHPLQTFRDIGLSFGAYFLRRNFGYWDQSVLGGLSAGAFFVLLMLGSWQRPQVREKRLLIAVALLLGFLALFLPHNAGIHSTYMPADAFFPSLLFFDWYYPYCAAVLACLFLGLFLSRALAQKNIYILALGLSFLISLSNVVHLRLGPPVSLEYHNWDESYRQDIAKKVRMVSRYVHEKKYWPTYLSFSVKDTVFIQGQRASPPSSYYCQLIPIKYLRAVEKEQIITPFANARSARFSNPDNDLSVARFFFDVQSAISVDLEFLRQRFGAQALQPTILRQPLTITPPVAVLPSDQKIVFFVKGKAAVLVRTQNEDMQFIQSYGLAYQLFEIPVSGLAVLSPQKVQLAIKLLQENEPVSLVGPFVY